MRRNKLPDTCFSVLPSTGQLIIIKNGENGYYPSEWDTGSREKNREIASDHNEQRGISDIQESAMLAGSMFGWNTPGANPQWYLDNAKYVNADILQGHVKDPVMSIYYPINGLLLRYEIVGKRRVYLPMDKLPNELMGMNAQFIMQPDLVCGRPVMPVKVSFAKNGSCTVELVSLDWRTADHIYIPLCFCHEGVRGKHGALDGTGPLKTATEAFHSIKIMQRGIGLFAQPVHSAINVCLKRLCVQLIVLMRPPCRKKLLTVSKIAS